MGGRVLQAWSWGFSAGTHAYATAHKSGRQVSNYSHSMLAGGLVEMS